MGIVWNTRENKAAGVPIPNGDNLFYKAIRLIIPVGCIAYREDGFFLDERKIVD
jgi:hypothetical protein